MFQATVYPCAVWHGADNGGRHRGSHDNKVCRTVQRGGLFPMRRAHTQMLGRIESGLRGNGGGRLCAAEGDTRQAARIEWPGA